MALRRFIGARGDGSGNDAMLESEALLIGGHWPDFMVVTLGLLTTVSPANYPVALLQNRIDGPDTKSLPDMETPSR
jgi:hypothetical protein